MHEGRDVRPTIPPRISVPHRGGRRSHRPRRRLVPFVVIVTTAIRGQGDLMSRGVFSILNEHPVGELSQCLGDGQLRDLLQEQHPLDAGQGTARALHLVVGRSPAGQDPVSVQHADLHLLPLGHRDPGPRDIATTFILLKDIGLNNKVWSLIPPYVVFALPFQIFVMRGFFRTIPSDLLDAARLTARPSLATCAP